MAWRTGAAPQWTFETMFRTCTPLVLASGSPRRIEMLAQLGLAFRHRSARLVEDVLPGESPVGYTLRLATAKAAQLGGSFPGSHMLGVDTVVVLGGRILGKPRDEEEAGLFLEALSGQEHLVVSGFSILRAGEPPRVARSVTTRVWVRALSRAEIRSYVASGEPMDKAGAYAIQGAGGCFIEGISGSYTNVVGLPLAEVVLALRGLGIIEVAAPR